MRTQSTFAAVQSRVSVNLNKNTHLFGVFLVDNSEFQSISRQDSLQNLQTKPSNNVTERKHQFLSAVNKVVFGEEYFPAHHFSFTFRYMKLTTKTNFSHFKTCELISAKLHKI